AKVQVLVRQIDQIRHIVVQSEQDALLLENSLIKSLQPRYNILLKDDKTYPWIVINKEPFPRVESTRQVRHDGSQYFGPYGSIAMQRSILEFIREVIPLRTCKLNLSEQAISRGRYGVCLQYHLGNCKAPCIGAQSGAEYSELVDMVKNILKGDLRPVRNYLEQGMRSAAEELKFELAQRYKQRIDALDNYQSRSVIVSATIVDCDIFSLLVDDDEAYCNFIRLRHGSIVALHTVKLSVGVESEQEDMLSLAIQYIVENIAGDISREVIVPFMPSAAMIFDGVNFTIPKRGEKANLLEFSLKSARIYRAEQMKNLEIKNPERHTERLMNAMQKELHLEHQPRYIECFDNSNLQGTNPVAACVVFRDGKPSRKEYRHFNVKSVEGPNDFASMQEIIYRRYSRLLEEEAPLPDLIIVDGGKGQLSSAYEILCGLGLESRIPIVGLAEKREEIFFPHDPMPYYLSRTGEPLKVVCHIRDEAHRFGITFHRQKRSKAFINSELERIEGIGPKSLNLLLRHFRTVAKVREASVEELSEVVGVSKARKIIEYFNPKTKI
ncbi:MAG: excinuclease ABC subunit C, partial [Alistipes sp.]|nr:excinuclease ABC subunit C [Alistipes sp.]